MAKPIDHTCLHLFVPADRPDRIQKAVASKADAVVIDLEDAVGAASKAAARSNLLNCLSYAMVPLILRLNAVGTAWHTDDLDVASRLPIDAVMLAKSETVADVEAVGNRTKLPIVALIESAVGVENAVALARACRRLAFGSVDYAADLSMGHTRCSLLAARSRLVFASRLAGIPGPIDGVTTAISDEAIISSDCAHALEMGFAGKLLIHPAQIRPAREAFAPADEEVEWARRIDAAAEHGKGVTTVDGEMIDVPVIARAHQILERARRAKVT